MTLQISKNRIIYEAFSNFSRDLSKAQTIHEIALVVKKYLKYLFNFNIFRICFIDDEFQNTFTFFLDNYWKEKENLLDFEKQILERKIPHEGSITIKEITPYIGTSILENPRSIGWYHQYDNLKICVSVIVDNDTNFDFSSIEILNMFVDSLTTKYKNIRLGNKLTTKNKNLQNALKTIAIKNVEIEKIIMDQKGIIAERTKDLLDKNKRLYELSSINAHNLREPLSRILGLLDIADDLEPEQIKDTILEYLKISAQDLDTTIKDVIIKSAKEIEILKFD